MSLKDAITEPIIFIDSENDVNFESRFDEVKYFPLSSLSINDIQIHKTVYQKKSHL